MSKTRYIKTDFWSDSFIETLTPEEKLLFIYLFSNERVDLCGIYEITIKKISFESGIELKNVESIIEKFSKKDKVYFIDGYIYIKNFIKHLSINPSITLGIERSKNALPEPILEAINKLGTGCIQDGTLKPIPILEPKLELGLKPLVANEYQLSIQFLKENRDKVYTNEIQIPDYVKDTGEWHKFIGYWTEMSKSGKIKAEGEKTFEIKRRFATWMSRKKETYQKESKVAKVY